MLSVNVEVLDPVIEPGQNVAVLWEVARSYADTNSSGAIEEQEVNNLTVVLDVLGGIKNQVEFTPTFDTDCYLDTDGNLVGVANVPIPVDALLGKTYALWATVDNGVDLPIAGRSTVPVSLPSEESTSGAGALASPFFSNYRNGIFNAPTTELTARFDAGSLERHGVIRVASSVGFPAEQPFQPFDVWITASDIDLLYGRFTVNLIDGETWAVTRREVTSLPLMSPRFLAGSKIVLDPVDNYAQQAGLSRDDILDYAESINGPPDGSSAGHADRDIADETVRALIARAAAVVELRAAHAFNDRNILDGDITRLKNKLPAVLDDVFQRGFVGFAVDTPWNPNLPTAVLVHGIKTSPDGDDGFFQAKVDSLGSTAKGKFNVLGFAWGVTGEFNGLDRSIGDVLTNASETNDKGLVIQAAVNLNKLLRYLDRSYEQVGLDGSTQVSVIAHSEGTVVATAAMSLDPTELNSLFAYGIKQALFIGANLEDTGSELFNTFPNLSEIQRPIITNLYSHQDFWTGFLGGSVLRSAQGLGHHGVREGFVNPLIDDFDADGLDDSVAFFDDPRDLDGEVDIVHTGALRKESPGTQPTDPVFYKVGWWSWLTLMQDQISFVSEGVQHPGGFTAVADNITRYGAICADTADSLPTTTDVPSGYGLTTGATSISPLPPQLSDVEFISAGESVAGVSSLGPPRLSVNQGDYFVAEALGAIDPDGYISRAEFYRDVNGNGLPDDNDQEFLGTDFHPGNDWKRAIYTGDWALGTYDIIAQVFDNGGNPSNLKVATVQIVDPTLPPGPLPAVFDNSQQPHYNVIPHQNGEVSYDPVLFELVPGRIDLWQITPQTGGGFSFETTGDTDTVLGLYDWSNGNLLAVDEDNGTGNNAEITHTLTAGHTYVVIVASQHGDSGHYGLDVTGVPQSFTATTLPAPLYEATVAESIATPFELDYFKARVPATTTTLNVVLDVGVGLDGYVRVENAAHETLATAFLAGTGDDETLMAIDVTPDEDVFLTVAALEGTTGSYTLKLDFGPDEPGLPATMDPPPADGDRIVPLPDGTFFASAESIAVPGQFRSYQFSTRNAAGGEYTFETFGDLDTQIGVYQRHSASNSTLIALDDDSGGGENARLTVNLNGGDDYIVIVRGEGTDMGNFDLSVAGPTVAPSNVVIAGLAHELTTNYEFLANNDRFLHFQVVAPDDTTSLTIQGENHASSPSLDFSLRVSDANGNVLATADSAGPGAVEAIANLPITAGETYYVTLYSEDYTVGDAQMHVDFNPNFTVGSGTEFPVNSTFFGNQEFPDVARNSAGQSVVVWGNPDFQRIDAQRFNANSQPVGAEFQVNASVLEFGLHLPAIGIDDNGNFVVVFGDNHGWHYRSFDSSGSPLTGDLELGFDPITADIAVEPDGRFYIVGGNIDQLVGRLFDASGSPLTGPIVLDDTTDNINDPAVAADGNGNFIVTWGSSSSAGSTVTSDIYALRVDSSGNIIDSGRNTHVQGTLSGRRFDDLDGDGLQDSGEAGVEGVTLLLDADGNGVQNPGELTQITNAQGDYTFTGLPEGVYSVVQIGGPTSGPAPLTEDFNRAESSDLGADWTELFGDLRIESNRLRSASGSSRAVFEPFTGIDQYVTLDVDYTTTGVSRSVEILLAYEDADSYLSVSLQDFGDRVGFKNVVITDRAYGGSRWPRMTGGTSVSQQVPVFTTARVFAGYDSQSHTLTLGIDADFDGVFETIVSRGGVRFEGLGTKVGIGTYNDVAIDNFSVNPNSRVVPPLSTVPTEAFQVAPGFNGLAARPAVASHGDGTFVVAFDGDPGDGSARNIYAQRFDANANPDGDLVLINTVLSGNQIDASVGLLSQGKYLVAWKGTDANAEGIRAQQVGVNLEPIGPEFTLNQTETGTQQRVALASDGDEHVIAVWEGPDTTPPIQVTAGIFGLDFTLTEVLESEITVTDTSGIGTDRFVDFGSVVFGSGGAFTPSSVTVVNDGNAPLIVNSVDIYGANAADYELNDSSPFTLNQGESRTIEVMFIGTGVGEYYAALRLEHNDNGDVLSGDFDADPYWVSLLAKIETPYAADFDEDGDVDRADLELWQTGYGSSTGVTRSHGDADADGDVDGRDFLVWQRQYGSGVPTPGDFDADTDVDTTDLGIWQTSYGVNGSADADGDSDSDGRDFLLWQRNYGAGVPLVADDDFKHEEAVNENSLTVRQVNYGNDTSSTVSSALSELTSLSLADADQLASTNIGGEQTSSRAAVVGEMIRGAYFLIVGDNARTGLRLRDRTDLFNVTERTVLRGVDLFQDIEVVSPEIQTLSEELSRFRFHRGDDVQVRTAINDEFASEFDLVFEKLELSGQSRH